MAETTTPRTKRDSIIAITDGATTYTIAKEPGDLTWSVPRETVNLFLDRGVIGATPCIRLGDDQPMELSFSAYQRDIVSATETFLPDLGIVFASGWVTGNWTSTLSATSDVKTWTTNWTIEGSDFGGTDRTLTFPFCSVRVNGAEGDPNVVNVAITSYALIPTFS